MARQKKILTEDTFNANGNTTVTPEILNENTTEETKEEESDIAEDKPEEIIEPIVNPLENDAESIVEETNIEPLDEIETIVKDDVEDKEDTSKKDIKEIKETCGFNGCSFGFNEESLYK